MTLPDKVTIPPEVMARQVGDETVILDLASGNYFGLDPVGARIWQLITEGRTPAAVRDSLLAEYEVSPDDLERDLDRLLNELLSQGLLSAG
ncbi:PqqD family protein [Ramlibacter sp. WS9]|uniref:PqqD family protein n=1 Tax=Ramlibacter sp. WS9 TaxID=1882741 RepID=UPI00130522F0|nr:PqqD family protein [Ramlibacter sp. WS9]